MTGPIKMPVVPTQVTDEQMAWLTLRREILAGVSELQPPFEQRTVVCRGCLPEPLLWEGDQV